REKGLCYNCDEKFKPGHKCKSKYLVLLADHEGREENKFDTQQDWETQVEGTKDIQEGTEISMLALAGQHNPNSIRITGMYHEHSIHVLIDSGSTNNFIQERVVTKLDMTCIPTTPFKVYVGNGDFIWCSKKCIK
ncbi:gag-asp_proteas domain-containing protein, partial [Cephalotus follicularis]